MINSEKGTVKLEGTARELYADFGCIAHSLRMAFEDEGLPKDQVMRFLTDAFNNGIEEELDTAVVNSEKVSLAPVLKKLLEEIDKKLKGGV